MLNNVKTNEPYYVYDGDADGISVGYVDEDNKWRILACPEIDYWWHIDNLKKKALQNRRQLIDDNVKKFMPNVECEKDVTKSEKGGILLHMNSVLLKAPDRTNWEDIECHLLYIGDTAWRHDPVLRCATFKKNEIVITRTPENTKKKTFDYIHMPIGLSGANKKEFVRENYKEIVKRAVKILSESTKFNKFGIPVNCLKVEKAVITCQDELILTFGLKEIKVDDEKKGEAV